MFNSNSQFLSMKTLRRMFSFIEFPRALGRSEALVMRMYLSHKCYAVDALIRTVHKAFVLPVGVKLKPIRFTQTMRDLLKR